MGSRAGGLPEVVRDGETGVLREVGDVEGMANGALEILRDRDRWSAMSKLAISDSRERFSRDAIVAQYEDLYRQAATAFRT